MERLGTAFSWIPHLRLELSGGVYHVTSRGDGREDIYLSDADREMWLGVFAEVCVRFNWVFEWDAAKARRRLTPR